MNVTNVLLSGYKAHFPDCEDRLVLGTYGSKGNEFFLVKKLNDWKDLTVTAIFQPSGVEALVPEDGMLEIPWEATQEALTTYEGIIVFKGVDKNGRLINTHDIKYKVEDHSASEGTTPADPTPSKWEEFIEQTKDLYEDAKAQANRAVSANIEAQNYATSAKTDADRATAAKEEADSYATDSKASSETSKSEADRATAAKDEANTYAEQAKNSAEAAAKIVDVGVDTTLTVSGAAADAKVTGDTIKSLGLKVVDGKLCYVFKRKVTN